MHGFMMEESCLTNFTAVYYEITGLVDEDRAVDVCLTFSKAVNTVTRPVTKDEVLTR